MPVTVITAEHSVAEQSRAKRLKAATSSPHEDVDRSIMSTSAFTNVDRYKQFLTIQYRFHWDVAALYEDPRLQDLFPDLIRRCRLPLVTADLEDLGVAKPAGEVPAFLPGEPVDVGTAVGWLYVAEGSNMGAALLRKEAAKIGLSDEFGARHLAPANEGPAPHWRAFVAALDAVDLTEDEEHRATAGANAAFARVQAHIDARVD
jgi:heme oxygenase